MNTETSFSVRPLQVGAEIIGLDLKVPIKETTRAALYAEWLKHGILLFRHNTATTIEQHLSLSRCFGELQKHPLHEFWADGEPYLLEFGGKKQGPAYIYDGDKLRVGRLPWHRDMAYTVDICKGAILRMVEAPPEDGETLFADSQKAYDAMPEELKARVANLEYKASLKMGPLLQSGPGAIWKTVHVPFQKDSSVVAKDIGMDAISRHPAVIHPVVIEHPETGAKCLFPSPTYVDEFIGLGKAASDALLVELCSYLTDPANVYVHRWEVNDMMLWDNRRFLHAALGYNPEYGRTCQRTTLAGSLATGRYFQEQVNTFVPAPNFSD